MSVKESTTPRQWLTQGETAEYLNIDGRTLRRMISSGEVPAYRVGPRLVRLDRADVDALLKRIPTGGGADA